MAVSDLCAELRNYFLPDYKNPQEHIHTGTFKVEGGQMQSLPFLKNGQYFRIVGSVFNDGVWKYGVADQGLLDEEFTGAVWEMVVPRDFISLSDELDEINDKIKADSVADTGFTSESFGGYSYTKRSGISEELQDRRSRIMDDLKKRYRRLVVL